MTNKNIIDFIKHQAEAFPDSAYGEGYRCSACLQDGTFIPCVILRNSQKTVELALRRFEQEKKGTGIFRNEDEDAYTKIVKHFITSGNKINNYDIDRVEVSKYAFPLSLLAKLKGETTMSWTAFVLEMRDGKYFQFATRFSVEFFDLPEGYTFADVVNLHNHSYINQAGQLSKLKQGFSEIPKDYDPSNTYREKPYFVCYTDN